jgi:hypothetical protein
MNGDRAMIQTVEELIKDLQTRYEPDEQVSYTLYSQADIVEFVSELGVDVVWDDVVDNFDTAIDHAQETLNDYLLELVEEYKDNNNDEEIG